MASKSPLLEAIFEEHPHPLAADLLTICKLAIQGGVRAAALRNSLGDLNVVQKADDAGPVTAADKEVNEMICGELHRLFPTALIVGEENADSPADDVKFENQRTFYADPIDGTNEYIKNTPEYSTLIGASEGGESVLGVCYHPAEDSLYFAAKGFGAFQLNADGVIKLECRQPASASDMTAIESRSKPDPRSKHIYEALGITNVVPMGSFGLKALQVATRKADAYLQIRGKASVWDACGVQCIVTEAGGSVRYFNGATVTYTGNETTMSTPFFFVASAAMADEVVAKGAEFVLPK